MYYNTKNSSLIPQEYLKYSPLSKSAGRLSEALKLLLKEKDFNSITTAEVAKAAKANESLIYRYFKDKRGLLHHVLAEYLKKFLLKMKKDLEDIHGPLDRLKMIMRNTLYFYNNDLVFAKILLIEVRNYPGYYESEPYQIIRIYANAITKIIEEGIEAGLIRNDITPSRLMQSIIGGLEHSFLPSIVFGYDIDSESLANEVYEIILNGVLRRKEEN
ncbi:MAG: TetR/AcrR family transcriptional regulator [Desulfobacteraceae bacterium]|nr:TetR/AcrR family transcriptional regulator [Desulfobacteraceae bacterium]